MRDRTGDHTRRAAPGWYPCEHPERPNDGAIRWHEVPCLGCHVAALASIRRWPDDPNVQRLLPQVVERTRPPSPSGL